MDGFLAACSEGDLESLERCLVSITDTKDLQQGLSKAIKAHQIAIVDGLLDHGVPIDLLPYLWAGRARSREVWQSYLNHGWQINDSKYGSTALVQSVYDPLLVLWMLEHGADPNLKHRPDECSSYQGTAIRSALAINQLESIKILVKHGAVLESNLLEPCIAPFMHEKIGIETVQYLLDAGLDPNVIIKGGSGTPLQLAVRYGLHDRVEAFLQAGADPYVENRSGETPLEEAEKSNNEAIVKLLETYS